MTKETLEKANAINKSINELIDIRGIFYSQFSDITIELGDSTSFANLKNLDKKSLKSIQDAVINVTNERIKELTKELENL